MSKKIIVSIPDTYDTDNVVTRIKQALSNDKKIAIVPVDYLVDVVPEIVQAILKVSKPIEDTGDSNNE